LHEFSINFPLNFYRKSEKYSKIYGQSNQRCQLKSKENQTKAILQPSKSFTTISTIITDGLDSHFPGLVFGSPCGE